METNPLYYGLSTKTKLTALGPNHIGIVRLIKSRIIQKDAQKIVQMAHQIQHIEPTYCISLVCTTNICSKSIALLKKHEIEVKFE